MKKNLTQILKNHVLILLYIINIFLLVTAAYKKSSVYARQGDKYSKSPLYRIAMF